MSCSRQRITWFIAALLTITATSVSAIDVAWICSGTNNWHEAACWDFGVTPCNAGAVDFAVTIDSGSRTRLLDAAGACEIARLILGRNRTLEIRSDSDPTAASLAVLNDAQIAGVIEVINANFTAIGPNTSFAGERPRVYASDGAQVVVAAPSFTSTSWFGTSGAWPNVHTHNLDLMRSTGPGSILDLSSLTWIDAGFDDGDGWDRNHQRIVARGGGRLDLRNVEWIRAPQSGDWVFLIAHDEGSIDLSALERITADRSGWTKIDVEAATLSLPSLQTVRQTSFELDRGGVVELGPDIATMETGRFWLSGGAQLSGGDVPAVYSSLRWYGGSGAWPNVHTHHLDLLRATGPETWLDLRFITDFDAGFDDGDGWDRNLQRIVAEDGAHVDLRSVERIQSPASGDWLVLVVSDDATVNLDSLRTVASGGSGWMKVDVKGSTLDLPSLESVNKVSFELDEAAFVTLGPNFTTIETARFWLAGGAQLGGGNGPADYSSHLWYGGSGAWPNVHTHDLDLFRATGPDTRLDLGFLRSIDAGFDDGDGWDRNFQKIVAADGAQIDLSGVEWIQAPKSGDWLMLVMSEGSRVDLDSLQTVSSAGGGWMKVDVKDSALDMPALESIGRVSFELDQAGVVTFGDKLRSVDTGRFWVSGGSQLRGASTPAAYSSHRWLGSSGAWPNVHTHHLDLFRATGTDTLLSLPGLTSIDAGFSDGDSWDSNRQKIVGTDGARVEMPNVAWIKAPASSDWLDISVGANAEVDLRRLEDLHTDGSGAVQVDVVDGSELSVGNLDINVNTSIRLDGGARIKAAGLRSSRGSDVSITLAHTEDRLQVSGSVDFGSTMTCTAAEGATLRIDGDLSYAHTDEAVIPLGAARMQFSGEGLQSVEVGGLDVADQVGLLANDNFGFGQLVVGDEDGTESIVQLVDRVDNGNRAAPREALYLFGIGHEDGLRIRAGARLVIDDINVYARLAGEVVHINSLIAGNSMPFDEGVIEINSTRTIVSRFSPESGGNAGTVTVFVEGTGFEEAANVRLCECDQDGEEVVATGDTIFISQSLLQATFDLKGEPPRLLTLDVAQGDGPPAVARQKFRVEAAGAHDVWVDVVGRDALRPGQAQRFFVTYGNCGNQDVVGTALWISGIPASASWHLNTYLTPPAQGDGSGDLEVSKVPFWVESDGEIAIPLFLPAIAAGDAGAINLTISSQQSFQLRAAVVPEWVCGSGDDSVSCLSGLLQGALKLPPLLDCYVKSFCLGYNLPDAIHNREVRSIAWESLGTLTQCMEVLGIQGEVVEIVKDVMSIIGDIQTWKACFNALQELLFNVSVIRAFDPNDKVGPIGVGDMRYTSAREPLRFSILFENDPKKATAPAQRVVITDHLDGTKLDLGTLRLGPIVFGDHAVTPPAGVKHFSTTVDMRPKQDLLVEIEAGLDRDSGVLTWTFVSIDPETGSSEVDARAGFLPVNYSRCSSDPTQVCDDENPCAGGDCAGTGEGSGAVFFTIEARTDLPSGTRLENQATITFDTEDPILTCDLESPTGSCPWLNTLDTSRPESAVAPLAEESESEFEVSWSGTDGDSGVAHYTIYVSEDGGPFTPWIIQTTEESGEFRGRPEACYAFYSVAVDASGNRELGPRIPDADTCVKARLADQRPGDCNQDGEVDVSDGICLLNYLFAGSPDRLPCGDGSPAGEANVLLFDWQGDGTVNIADATALLNYLFGGGATHVRGEHCIAIEGCDGTCLTP